MEKEVREIFGKKNYLLGKDKNGSKVWLEEAKWECNWYWGFGYVEIYNRRYDDIESHQHFNNLFLEKNIFESFINYFEETTLNNEEIWQLLELINQYYILRKYSDCLHTKGTFISSVKGVGLDLENEKNRNKKEYERINTILLPNIFQKIYEILESE